MPNSYFDFQRTRNIKIACFRKCYLNWSALEAEFDWLRSLADCRQDPRYHAEGKKHIQ